MTPPASSATALIESFEPSSAAPTDPRERRAFARVDPMQLPDPLIARVKYGPPVTLVDVSAGGALFESPAALRPDSTLVLEVTGAGVHDAISVVSRVLRCHVSGVRDGIRYRSACVFKRPLDNPALAAAAASPVPRSVPDSFARTDFALKMIVEGYRRRARSSQHADPSQKSDALLDSLNRLRQAAVQRVEPVDRSLAEVLAGVVPVLQRNESAEAVTSEILVQLARHIPALSLRIGGGSRPVGAGDAERVTLNVWPEAIDRATLTAEYPAGFDIDETQFRLLKAGAYLLGLAASWDRGLVPADSLAAASARRAADVAASNELPAADLPAGWQRIVVRFVDGKLLRGYSNNFHPDMKHLHLCPDLSSSAEERLFVPIARLKAVFFVRDLAGNADHIDSNTFDHAPRGRKVEVTFRDDEVIVGSTLNYKPTGQGFFLDPANSRGNNHRIYVVLGAVRHLRFL